MNTILSKAKNTSITVRLSKSLKKELEKIVAKKVLSLSTPEELYRYSVAELVMESIIKFNNINVEVLNQTEA